MIAFLTGLSLRTWLIVIAVVAVTATIAGIYLKGRHDASADQTLKEQSQTIEILRERSKTDEKIKASDNSKLCLAIGGVWDPEKSECL